MPKTNSVDIIGGGLAGSEAAFYLLKRGYEVRLFEARPNYKDGAHETDLYGELVCSNSLKGKKLENACGLLKEEMRRLGSLSMWAADLSEVPSGNALSVDREAFAGLITQKLRGFPNLIEINEEVKSLSDKPTLLCSGPLSSPDLIAYLEGLIGSKGFSFYDASAPILKKDTIDFSIAYFKSRYGQGDDSYINCPFDDKQDYLAFVHELTHAELAKRHEFDTYYFEGCLPIEVIASRGADTLRHGPLKPVGLEQEGKRRPYAVVQLRQDDRLGNCYNMVGFQTNLKYPEQKRVFSLIPGLKDAEFVRYGLMHRNFYLDSPNVLNPDLSLKAKDNVFVAGQITGVEGYVESAASGMLSAMYLDMKLSGKPVSLLGQDTMLGALMAYVVRKGKARLEPMNANWALFPEVKKECRGSAIEKALEAVESFREQLPR